MRVGSGLFDIMAIFFFDQDPNFLSKRISRSKLLIFEDPGAFLKIRHSHQQRLFVQWAFSRSLGSFLALFFTINFYDQDYDFDDHDQTFRLKIKISPSPLLSLSVGPSFSRSGNPLEKIKLLFFR